MAFIPKLTTILVLIIILTIGCTPTVMHHKDPSRNFTQDQYVCHQDLTQYARNQLVDPNLWILLNQQDCMERKFGWVEVQQPEVTHEAKSVSEDY